jgi:phosphoribosyl-ATP pyrophosphohydrolase/phosphoribosyl-AMP cyclohydrolase/histidinol dehydrogenase
LNTRTCFGPASGLSKLSTTLSDRKQSAPEGSYTKRLFNDTKLLKSKIMEEADELCSATSKEEIAWEAADLFYFALTKCIGAGVTLRDIERHLDIRSQKVTRRAGDSKRKWDQVIDRQEGENPINSPQAKKIDSNGNAKESDLKMKSFSLFKLSSSQVKGLLIRPIIKTDEIMNKVQPIVKKVREEGDKALLEFTAKFDQVNLKHCVIEAPFDPKLMEVTDDVKKAIDQAYENIRKFHLAQLDKKTLIVETMPGIKCSRFSRPIESVGLYVPGGTAVLPSSTLMLGIPAQVAGCKNIVIATPPTKQGRVVPEVMYAAHKVGASCILLAGGAQAVAAMAYGTPSVPKVDKICGPGNQYVTAAKMIAQVCLLYNIFMFAYFTSPISPTAQLWSALTCQLDPRNFL